MTGLGAAIYLGFFALAASWLFTTSDGLGGRDRPRVSDHDAENHDAEGQTQRPVFSNSTSAAADAESFSPDLVSHSSLK